MAGTAVTVTPEFSTSPESVVEQLRVSLNKVIDDLEVLRTGVAELSGSAVYDPASLVDAAGETTTVTVTGAALGDYAQASFSLDLQGIILFAWVSAANTVSVRFQNESGATVDLASGTITVRVSSPGLVDAAGDLTAFKVNHRS